MLAAGISYLILSIVYWWFIVASQGESPLISALIMGMLYGIAPLIIVGISYYLMVLGSFLSAGASIVMIAYWALTIVVGTAKVNPALDYCELSISLVFLIGSAVLLVSSNKIRI